MGRIVLSLWKELYLQKKKDLVSSLRFWSTGADTYMARKTFKRPYYIQSNTSLSHSCVSTKLENINVVTLKVGHFSISLETEKATQKNYQKKSVNVLSPSKKWRRHPFSSLFLSTFFSFSISVLFPRTENMCFIVGKRMFQFFLVKENQKMLCLLRMTFFGIFTLNCQKKLDQTLKHLTVSPCIASELELPIPWRKILSKRFKNKLILIETLVNL